MSSCTDYSESISFFRSAVDHSVSPRLYSLKKELSRLNALPDKCEEEFRISLFGKNHYKDPRVIDYLKASKWDIAKLLAEFGAIILGQDPVPTFGAQDKTFIERKLDRARCRAKELVQVKNTITSFTEQIQSTFVLNATLDYAGKRKVLAISESGEKEILSPEQVVSALSEFMSIDASIGEAILIHFCEQLLVPLKTGDLSAAEQAVLSFGIEQRTSFSDEITALKSGLQGCGRVLKAMDTCISVSKSIDPKYYLQNGNDKKDLPEELLSFFPITRSELEERLVRERGLFSDNEYLSICGERISESNDEVHQSRNEYSEPEADYNEYIVGLKDELKDLNTINKIADVVVIHGYIKEADKPSFVFRLSGNSKPKRLSVIKWRATLKGGPGSKSKANPGFREPNEFYYLLHYMYKGKAAENFDKLSRFFIFDSSIVAQIKTTLSSDKNGAGQKGPSAPPEFQRDLNKICPSVFKVKR